MPAAVMWARGLDDRPITSASGTAGRAALAVATQLHANRQRWSSPRPTCSTSWTAPRSSVRSRCASSPSDGRRFRFAMHHTGTDAELDALVKDVRENRRAGGRDLRRVSRVRTGSLHVPRRLPAVRQRRRHGAPQQHGHFRNRSIARGRDQICSTPSRTSSFTAGTSSASARRVSSRSTSIARTSPASSGWPKGSRSTTARWRCSAPGSWISRRPLRRFDRLIEACLEPRSPGALGRRDEPHGAVHRRRPRDRSRRTGRSTVISYYPFGGAIALALDLTLRDRSDGRLSLDDFMRAMWTTYGKPGGTPRRLRRSPVHDRRRRSDAGGGQRRRGVRARLLRALHPGARRRRLRAPARAAPGFAVRKRNPGRRLARRSAARVARRRRVADTRRADLADIRRRPRRRRRAAAVSTASGSPAAAISPRCCSGTNRATRCRSSSSTAPA